MFGDAHVPGGTATSTTCLDHFSLISPPRRSTPHAPCDALYLGAMLDRVLTGGCTPMMCPIWGFRPAGRRRLIARSNGQPPPSLGAAADGGRARPVLGRRAPGAEPPSRSPGQRPVGGGPGTGTATFRQKRSFLIFLAHFSAHRPTYVACYALLSARVYHGADWRSRSDAVTVL